MEDSPKHPIAVASERTGLSQDLLRIWERRYQAVEPTRSPGGHRTYSDADIARLRLLHAVTSAGRSIGQVARLSTSELTRMAQEDNAARAERGKGTGARESRDAASHTAARMVELALASTAQLDAPDLEHSLRRAIAQLGITSFIEDVASPILRRIGEEWHAGRLTIAHEHLASSTIHDIVAESMRAIGRGTGDTVLVATPTGERHAIGAALVGATAASEGWRVVYLGTDLPASDIAAAAIATKARVIAMSVTYVEDRARTLGELRTLRALIPPSISIIVGGAGVAEMEDDLRQLGLRVGASLRDLRDALASANDAIDRDAA